MFVEFHFLFFYIFNFVFLGLVQPLALPKKNIINIKPSQNRRSTVTLANANEKRNKKRKKSSNFQLFKQTVKAAAAAGDGWPLGQKSQLLGTMTRWPQKL